MITKLKPNVFIFQHESFLYNNTIVIVEEERLIIIDPSFNLTQILEQFKYQRLTIVLTHAHSDHTGKTFLHACEIAHEVIVSAAAKELLKRKCFNELFFGVDFIDIYPDKWKFVHDSECVDRLEFILTPGHSVDSMCVRYQDLLITGDCLFATDIGRTDFPWSDHVKMQHSLKKLKHYLIEQPIGWIIPGHEEWITKTEILKTHQWLLAIN